MRRLNLIAWDNGFGLTRNLRLLGNALTVAGTRSASVRFAAARFTRYWVR